MLMKRGCSGEITTMTMETMFKDNKDSVHDTEAWDLTMMIELWMA
jgi:hypothetical protein